MIFFVNKIICPFREDDLIHEEDHLPGRGSQERRIIGKAGDYGAQHENHL